jgi:predicted solute-binding protein
LKNTDPGPATRGKVRVCAVSYLNTVPLVWGMLRGPQKDVFDLSFAVPSVLADRLETGNADIGIVPCAELDRLQLEFLPETGIACRGAVRSILLISKGSASQIRTLAADSSSRTSVMLARIIVAERYGVTPQVVSMAPDVESMLAVADAALIIGDPALRIDLSRTPHEILDLGAEWLALTGLPMVFAVWAGKPQFLTAEIGRVFADSCRFGLADIDAIVRTAPGLHGISVELAREYLTRHIVFELGPRELEGLALFRRLTAEIRSRDEESASILLP